MLLESLQKLAFKGKRWIGIDIATGNKACKNSWLTELYYKNDSLIIEKCVSLQQLSTCKTMEEGFAWLVSYLTQQENTVIGIDASFSIPAELIDEAYWSSWLKGFSEKYPDASTFRQKLKTLTREKQPEAAMRQPVELKRLTDKVARTPYSPYNLRHYRQCFHTIANLLYPLAVTHQAYIWPLHQPTSYSQSAPLILEVCPASWLKAKRLYQPYKGSSTEAKDQREWLLGMLSECFVLAINNEQYTSILQNKGGDALDSLLAALIVWQSSQQSEQVQALGLFPDEAAALEQIQKEGWVLF